MSTLLFESDFKHYFRYTDGAVLSNLDRVNVEQIEPYKSTGMYTVHRTLMYDVSTGWSTQKIIVLHQCLFN